MRVELTDDEIELIGYCCNRTDCSGTWEYVRQVVQGRMDKAEEEIQDLKDELACRPQNDAFEAVNLRAQLLGGILSVCRPVLDEAQQMVDDNPLPKQD